MNLDKNVKNSEEFSYLVNLALDQKVSWTMLKGFLNELVSSLEASKKLNAVLLDELQSLHSKTIENQSETMQSIAENKKETFNVTEDKEFDAEVKETAENGSDDEVMVLFTKQETINDEDDLQPEGNLINETHEIETQKPDKLDEDQNSLDGDSEKNEDDNLPVETNDKVAEDTIITDNQIKVLKNSSERIANPEEFENNSQSRSYEMNDLQYVFTENVNEPVDNQSEVNSLCNNDEASMEATVDNEKVISFKENDDGKKAKTNQNDIDEMDSLEKIDKRIIHENLESRKEKIFRHAEYESARRDLNF